MLCFKVPMDFCILLHALLAWIIEFYCKEPCKQSCEMDVLFMPFSPRYDVLLIKAPRQTIGKLSTYARANLFEECLDFP